MALFKLLEAIVVELTDKECQKYSVVLIRQWRSIEKFFSLVVSWWQEKIPTALLLVCTTFRNAVASMMLWWI